MTYDSHMHSNFSFDSDMTMEHACQQALKLKLQGITFTEHLDVRFPDSDYREPDWAAYFKAIAQLRQQYWGIRLFAGVEIGYRADTVAETSAIVQTKPFDYIINSVHVLDGKDLYEEYYKEKSKKEAYTAYLQAVVDSIKHTPDYDTVGHIGYLRRYSPYPDYAMDLHDLDYHDLIDEALQLLVQQGRGLDINTSGYRDVFGRTLHGPIPDYALIRRYMELGGDILVLGSDAHREQHIADGFTQTKRILSDMGVRHLAYFDHRKPIHYPVDHQ